MKSLATITIKASARHDLKEAEKILAEEIEQARMRINNGTQIKWSVTNGDDPHEMMVLMGQLYWWTLGKVQPKAKTAPKKKGWGIGDLFREGFKAAKELYEFDPESELK